MNTRTSEFMSASLIKVMEQASNGMAIINAEAQIQHTNIPFQSSFSQKPEPLSGIQADFLLRPLLKSDSSRSLTAVIQHIEKEQAESWQLLMIDENDKKWDVVLSPLAPEESASLFLLSIQPAPMTAADEELEQILPEILRSTSDLVGLADVEFNMLFLNQASRESLGYGVDEDISAYSVFDLIPESEYEHIRDTAIPQATRNGRWEGKSFWLTKEGLPTPVSSVIQVHKDPKGNPMFFSNIARDISKELENGKLLEEKERKYRTLIERITEAFVAVDKEGAFEYINPAAAQMLGTDPELLIGKNAWELFAYAKVYGIYDKYLKAIETQEIQRHFEYFENSDRWVEFTLYPSENGLSFFFKNVTELKKAEAKITEMNARLSMLEKFINLSTDSFQVSDVNGRFVYLNQAAENRLGISRENAADYHVHNIETSFQDQIAWDKHVDQLRAEGSMTVQGQNLNKQTGRILPMEVNARLEKIDDQEYVIAILRDINERLEQERMLSERTALLEYQNEQLEDFCNMVSHNLRAPLANMDMLVELLENTQDMDQKKMLAAQFKPIISRLNIMFGELMESIQVRRLEEIHHEKINLREYIENVLKGFAVQMSTNNVSLNIDLERVNVVHFPPQYMNNLLHNLLSNCFKYAHPERSLEIRISTKKKGRSVVLSIADNGLGMDLENYGDQLFRLNRVFHKHPEAKGFGLYITRTQIESVGGRIWATSQVDEGSTFYVEFKPPHL